MRSAIRSEVFPLAEVSGAICTHRFHCLKEHEGENRPDELLAARTDATEFFGRDRDQRYRRAGSRPLILKLTRSASPTPDDV
jgi:hypothetical protein